jgi:hypothetical protein
MKNKQHIELLVLSDFGSKEEVIKTNVSLQEIQNVMDGINWEHFHQVVLSRSDYDWIEVGGNLKEDGLACIFEKDGEQFVIDEAPTSVREITEILISYFYNDGEFQRKYEFTGETKEEKKTEVESKKHQDWDRKHEQESKKEKIANFRRFLLVLVAVIAIVLITFFGLS